MNVQSRQVQHNNHDYSTSGEIMALLECTPPFTADIVTPNIFESLVPKLVFTTLASCYTQENDP